MVHVALLNFFLEKLDDVPLSLVNFLHFDMVRPALDVILRLNSPGHQEIKAK